MEQLVLPTLTQNSNGKSLRPNALLQRHGLLSIAMCMNPER